MKFREGVGRPPFSFVHKLKISGYLIHMNKQFWIQLFSFVSIIGCASSPQIAPQADKKTGPSGLTAECEKFIQALPPSYEHGFLDVPENWEKPKSSPQLHVFYYYFKVADKTKTPIVFFNGGPGFSGHELLQAWNAVLPKSQVPFVLMDQRGTGCSSHYPVIESDKEAQKLSHYGSRSIVRDAEALRQHLFGKNSKWKVFGQSYGGLIVHRYLMMEPEGIISAHIHGFAIPKNEMGDYYFRMLGQRRISKKYFAQHPLELKKAAQIRSQLKPDMCFLRNKFKICGEGIWDGILANLFNGKQTGIITTSLALLLKEDGKLDTDVLANLADKYILSMYGSTRENTSENPEQRAALLARMYIGKLEMNSGIFDPLDPGNCNLILKTFKEKGENSEKWPLNTCRFVQAMNFDELLGDMKSRAAAIKSESMNLDLINSALSVHEDIPIYLYSGSQDSFEPTELFKDEKSEITRIHYLDFPNSGHEGFVTEPQVWKDLLAN